MKPRPEHFPMTTGAYCQDCGELGNNLRVCACCGSVAIIGLAGILNRVEQREVDEALDALERMEK